MVEAEMTLEKELLTYRRELSSLLKQQGKYVVIQGDDVIGTFGDYEDALRAGYEKCGIEPFLVKQIEAVDTIHYFSRDLTDQCRTSP